MIQHVTDVTCKTDSNTVLSNIMNVNDQETLVFCCVVNMLTQRRS